MNTDRQRQDAITLELLDAIEQKENISQRSLSRQLGVALGLTNSYLRRCIRKGYVKATQAPANRYLYYLTPTGFAEKSRLTAQYLSYSLSFYRKAGESCRRVFEACEQQGRKRILLIGISDLAEIATLRASEHPALAVVGLCDVHHGGEVFLGRPVWATPADALPHDVCVLTDLADPRSSFMRLAVSMSHDRILVPDVLGFDATSL